MKMLDLCYTLQAHLSRLEIASLSATVDEVTKFSEKYAMSLNEDWITYFTIVNGMIPGKNDNLASLYSLQKVIKASEYGSYFALDRYNNYYIIGDYDFDGFYWIATLDEINTTNILCTHALTGDQYTVASSLSDFITKYIKSGPASLLV